jgi:transcriptional regulator with XRE-family HTH domain
MLLDPYQNLGQAIKRQIEAKGYPTVEGFAHEHAIPKGTLSKIVNGKVDAKYSTLLRIAQGLGVGVAELLPAHPAPGNWVMERPASAYRAGPAAAGKRKRRG